MPRVKTMRVSIQQQEKRFRAQPDRNRALRFSVVTRLGPDAQERQEQDFEGQQLLAEGRLS